MYNGSLENNFRKRRKTSVNLKPVGPISLNTATLTKFLKNISSRFRKTDEVANFKRKESENLATIATASNSVALKREEPDLAPLLREITTKFFENNYQKFSEETFKLHAHQGRNKGETSVCNFSNLASKDSCRRKRSSKVSKIDVVDANSDLDLKAAKQCVSASAFLTTSFFSLSHKPEYSTYPIHINLHYAEDHSADANTDKSSQYCEKDFLELNKNAKTSTRGLQCFSDNSTQSEYVYDSTDYLAHNITAKVAHFFELTPVKKSKIRQKSEKAINNSKKINKGTNTSLPLTSEQEPTLLYVNSTRYFVSTDDTTMERSSDDERSKSNFRERRVFRRNVRPLNTKNCYTSTSETRISPEMCPKFKEWYEFLQTNMINHNAAFCHFGQLKNVPDKKEIVNREKESKCENDCIPQCITRQSMSNTNITKALSCKEAMQKLSEFLGDTINDCKNDLQESFEDLEKLANERNFLDILNQKYPTFIGFQLNENQKMRHNANRKIPNKKKRVPKIIIREKKRHSNVTNNKSGSESDHCIKPESSKTSIISVVTNNTNVAEIKEIIDTLLPKDVPKFKGISSEGLEKLKTRQNANITTKNNSQDDLLRLEVEKIVDELLDEVPSTSWHNNRKCKGTSPSQNSADNIWHLKNNYSSTSLSNDIEMLNENLRCTVYSEKQPSQTVIPLFHKIKIQETSKKNRSDDRVKFRFTDNEDTKLLDRKSKLSKTDDSYLRKSSLKRKATKQQELNSKDVNIQNENDSKESPDLKKGFYAQIIQKTSSAEHPLITTKLSQSSSKSSLHSFIKNLLICLKYADSNSRLQNRSIESDDYLLLNHAAVKEGKEVDTMTNSSSILTPFSSDADANWKERKLLSIPAEPEKIDKDSMFSQEMNTIGVQVLISKHVKDKNMSSPSLPGLKMKSSSKKNSSTQTRVSTKVEALSRGSSMHHDGGPCKPKPTIMHSTSSANKKVSEIGTCSKNIRVLSEAMVQKVNSLERNTQNSSTFLKQNNWNTNHKRVTLIMAVGHSSKNIKRRKSCNMFSLCKPSKNWLAPKTNSTGKIATSFSSADILTSNLSTSSSKHKDTESCFAKDLYKNGGLKLESPFCSNLGHGDVRICNCDRLTRECTILSHIIHDEIINNLTQNQFFDKRKDNSEVISPTIIFPALTNEHKTSTKPNSSMMLVYEMHDNKKDDLVVKQHPSLDNATVIQRHTSDLCLLPEIKKEADSKKNGKTSLAEEFREESLESDIYRFKPTDQQLDDIYLERIRHIWLKSGLRKHLSQLSNLKLKPVLEWRKLKWPDTNEPEPVLEKLDVEPYARETEIIEISRVDPKTASKLYISETELPQEDDTLDKNIFPILFNKLKTLDRNQKFQIQLSSSESDQDTIEPTLANVGPSLEHLDDAFIDWILGLGIPLAKISQQEVQTSTENIRKLKLFKLKTPKEPECFCDKGRNVSDNVSPANIHIKQKRNGSADVGCSTLRKKSYAKMQQILSNRKNIQKEILNTLNDVINKLEYKVQKQVCTPLTSMKAKCNEQRIFLPSTNIYADYCGLRNYPEVNHICRVKIDKNPTSKFKKFENGIKEKLNKRTVETNEPSFDKKSFLKHLREQILSPKNKSMKTTDASSNTEKYSQAEYTRMSNTQKRNNKFNVDKNEIDSRFESSNPAAQKLYSSFSQTETQLNEKLSNGILKWPIGTKHLNQNKSKLGGQLKVQMKTVGTQKKTHKPINKTKTKDKDLFERYIYNLPVQVALNNQNVFTMMENHEIKNISSANSAVAHRNESRIEELLQHRQCSRISEAYRLCLYNFEKHTKRSNKIYISVKNRRQQKTKNTHSRLKIQLKNSNSNNSNLTQFSANTENCSYPIATSSNTNQKCQLKLSKNSRESLVFAIKSLEKLVTKYYSKSDYSNLIDMQRYQYAILRKTFKNERSKYLQNSVAEGTTLTPESSHESDASSSDGYFSNTSSLEDVAGLKSQNWKDCNTFSEKSYSPTNIEKSKSETNSSYQNSNKIQSNQSSLYNISKKLSNTKSKNSLKEAYIRRSLDDFLNIVLFSPPSQTAKDVNIKQSKSWTRINSLNRCNNNNIRILIRQNKNPVESEFPCQKSNSKVSTNSNTSNNNHSNSNEKSFTSSDNSNNSSKTLMTDSKQAWFRRYENLEEKDDVWEIINLLSQLCPRVLCKYYIKQMFD